MTTVRQGARPIVGRCLAPTPFRSAQLAFMHAITVLLHKLETSQPNPHSTSKNSSVDISVVTLLPETVGPPKSVIFNMMINSFERPK
ncbi:hypothetical protein Leryth_002128 [Lithospermum erythrorhizon]|nr:hypothetical protein Leryth_002128 [Lithospermum erythrorhizon]